MKKSLRLLLTLALVLVMVLSLTACVSNCELGKHTLVDISGAEATCTQEGRVAHKKCDICDLLFDQNGKQIKQEDTVIAKLGHDLSKNDAVAPSCTATGSVQYWECGTCNKKFEDASGTKELTGTIIVDKLAHNTANVAEVPATCTTDGVKAHQKCDGCDALFINGQQVDATDLVIAKLGHTEVIDPAVAATCTTAGKTEGKHCSACSEVIVAQQTVEALGHTEAPLNAVPATCTTTGLSEGKKCSVCEEIIVAQQTVPALGHDEVDHEAQAATCTAIGWDAYVTCSRCDYTTYKEIAATGHTYEQVAKQDATCTEAGHKAHYFCDVCDSYFDTEKNAADYNKDIEIPATGHTEVVDEAVDSTCTETGLTEGKHCSVCHEVLVAQTVVPALGHDEVEYQGKPATCIEAGYKAYVTCSRCDYTTFEELPATGHALTHHDAKSATCTTFGWYAYENCSECAYSTYEEIPELGHDLIEHDSKLPTCTENGWYGYVTCSRCDLTNYSEMPKWGHTEETIPAVAPDCLNTGLTAGTKCSVCQEVLKAQEVVDVLGHDEVTHEAKDPTCTAIGWDAYVTCSRCDYTTYKEIAATGHTEVTDAAVAATCTTDGKTAGKHCSVCNEVTVPQTVVPAKGHKEVTDAAVAATCTTDGKTAGSHCSVCDAVITAQQVVPATGHTEEVVVGKDATCTATGLTEGKKCLVCGETTVKQDTIAKLDHTEVIDKAVAATCTTAGKTAGKHCSVCSTTIVAQEVVPALGHDYKNTVTQPTCTEQGYTTHTCFRCDDTKIDTYVAATGHTEVIVEAVAATCTTDGKTEGKHCSVCQFVIKAQTVVPATGHSEVTVVGKPATCTEAGLTDGKFCTECGTTTVAQTIIPTKEHTPVTVAGKPATCTESGLTDGSKCSACNKVITEQQVIDAKGHTEKTLAAVAATCTEDGLTEGKQCSACNKVLVAQETIAALGHDMDAGIVTTPATCTAAGVKTYRCERQDCDHVTTEAIDATGHTNVNDPAVAPTCEETGLTEGEHCSVCGTVLAEQEVLEALGHDNKAVVTDPTCEQDGYTTYTCQREGCNHSFVEVDKDSALGHDWQTIIDKPASYTETGLSHEECSRCDARQNENTVIEKLDHEHDYEQTVTAPTCTTDGYTTYKCTICDHTYTDNKVNKLNHNFGEWVVTTPATCENAGEKTRTCSNDASHKETESIPATGHAEASKYAVIDQKLYSVKTCECATTRKPVPAGTVVEISNEADLLTVAEFGYSVKLTADINLTRTIQIVGKTLTIDLNGKTLTADWESDGVVEVLHIHDGSNVTITGNGKMVSGGTYTASTNSVISCRINSTLTIENGTFISESYGTVIFTETNSTTYINGGKFESKEKFDGIWFVLDIDEDEEESVRGKYVITAGEFVNYNPANSAGDGDYTNKLDSANYHSIKDGNSYFVSAHTVVTDATVAPTCEETGLTAGSHCSVCNAVIVAQQEINALGHSFTVYTPKNNATCLEDGTKTATCDRCDATDTITDEDSALGHQLVQHEAKDATCRENEKWWETYETCARCDHSTKVEKDPIAHTVVTDTAVSATCTTAGKTEGSHCSVCEKTIVAQQTINALNHDYEAVVTAPTCTQAGYTTYTCQRENCGDTYTGNPTAATGHTEETIPAVNPTCTVTGLTAGTKCSTCGTILLPQTTIDALNHNLVVDEEVPATCTKDGATEGKHCDRCGFVSVAQQVIPAAGHDHKGVVTAPTCEAEGYTTYTCHCGDTYTDDEVDALGHDEVAYEAQAPTCIATGHDAYVTCTRCSYTTYKEREALSHNFENYISNNNETCLADGTKTATCTRCPTTDTITNEGSALGHKFEEEFTVDVPATCTTLGSKSRHCERCTETTDITEVPALDHDWGTATYNWSDDHSTCTATHTCQRTQCGKVESETATLNAETGAKVTAQKTRDADCVNPELSTYTATFTISGFETQTVENIQTAPELEHDYSEEYTTDLEPTCDEAGWESKHCTREGCDATTDGHEIDALGHNIEDVEWGSDDNGHFKLCVDCNNEAARENHNWDEGVVTAPTCTEDGYTTYTCTDCGDSYTANTVDALGHDLTHHEAVTATCDQVGYEEYWSCEACDKLFADEDATIETTLEDVTIPENGHDIDGVEWSVDAENGKHYKECAECGERVDEAKHSSTAKPENTHKDYHTFTCDDCDAKYTEDHNVANGCDDCEIDPPKQGWFLVTDASTLKAGDQIVIVASGYDVAMSTTQNGNNRGQVAVTKNDNDTINTPNENVQIITLEAGKVSGTFAFAVESTSTDKGYLTAISGTGNYLRTTTTLDKYSSWSIAINDNVATILAQSGDRISLHYNPSSKIFSCYAVSNTQKGVSIYRYESAGFICNHTNTTTTTNPATCLAAGSTVVTCNYCDLEISNDPIAKLPHEFVNPQPTVGDSTTHTLTCQLCQTETKVEAHDWQDDLHECVCGAEEPKLTVTVVTKPVENQTALYSITTGDHYEGDEITLTINVGALQTRQYVVVTLNDSQDALVLTENSYTLVLTESVTFTIEVKEQTCEHPGLSEKSWTKLDEEDQAYATLHIRYCGEEGCDYFETQEHSLTHVDAQDATCEEIGWDAYDYCACGYTTYSEISATGHNYKRTDTSSTHHTVTCQNEGCAYSEQELHDTSKGDCVCGKKQPKDGWFLVTDVNELAVGDKIVIVANGAENSDYALSTNQKSNNRGAASVTKNGQTVTFSEDVQIIVLEAGKTDGTFAFYVVYNVDGTETKGYLYAGSSTGNQLKTKTTLDNHGSWEITIQEGVASIIATQSSNRNVMQYNFNNDSPLFACYASASQTPLAIYKLYDSSCKHVNETENITKQATCKEVGSVTYTCTYCGETRTVELPLAEHTEVVDAAQDATCTETGLTEGKHCSVCDAVIVAQQVVPAQGHTTGNGECERCHQNIVCPHNNQQTTCTTTCTEDGATIVTCLDCNTELSREDKTATGHAWSDWAPVASQKHERTCETCQEVESASCDYDVDNACECGRAVITTISKALLAEEGAKVLLEGTVESIYQAWSDQHGNISVYITDGESTILVFRTTKKVEIHDQVTVSGVITLYNGKQQVAAGETIISHIPHECNEYTEADCLNAGKCVVCEKVDSEGHPALGHTTEKGTCERCGEEIGGSETPSESKTITFNFGDNGAASHYDGSGATTYSETVDGYTLSITDGTNMYTGARDKAGNSCIKFGTSSKAGSMTFTVPEGVTSVVIYVAAYKEKTATVDVNGIKTTLTQKSDYGQYDKIVIDTTNTKTISFKVSSGYRAMLNTIEFIVNG